MESADHIVRAKTEWGALKISYGDDVDRAMLDMEKEIEAHNFLTDYLSRAMDCFKVHGKR